ncbi:tyrosine phosphatase family domain-containing protein [Trichoderma austrokoningii]
MAVPEPYICIPGVPNFRDIGGYAIASETNQQFRRNVVFRSALPRYILDDGSERARNKMQMLGIGAVFDLRSEPEFLAVRAYDRRKHLLPEMHRVSAPVFRPEEYNSDFLADQYMESGCGPEGFVQTFNTILEAASHPENKARPFAQILEHLSPKSNQPSTQPLLIHCDLGMDRTAVICGLILSLCGVSDQDVAKDYHQSETELAVHLEKCAAEFKSHSVFKYVRGTADDAKTLHSVREDNMVRFLESLREKHGSIEQCIKDHNLLDDEGISRFKANMIVDAATNQSAATSQHASNHKIIGTQQPNKTYTDRKSTRVVALRSSGEVAVIHVKVGNYYKLPGGGIKADESHPDAALREVKEETGAVIALRGSYFATTEEYRFHLHQTSYCYLADVLDDTGEPCLTDEEIADGFTHQWMSIYEATEVMAAAEPTTEFGCFVKERDTYVLAVAAKVIGARLGK